MCKRVYVSRVEAVALCLVATVQKLGRTVRTTNKNIQYDAPRETDSREITMPKAVVDGVNGLTSFTVSLHIDVVYNVTLVLHLCFNVMILITYNK